jgi:hypothetical protein
LEEQSHGGRRELPAVFYFGTRVHPVSIWPDKYTLKRAIIFTILDTNMNKAEIAETLRQEVGHLEVSIKKLQERCERLKGFVLDLEAEIAGPGANASEKPGLLESKQFRKVIDSVFGEKPKRPRR